MAKMFCGFDTYQRGDVGELTADFAHNTRTANAENAEKELKYLNKELIPLKGENYIDFSEQRIAEIKIAGTQKTTIRSNAVIGTQYVFNYSNDLDGKISIDDWCEKCKAFLINEYGEENIGHMVLHMDEPERDEDDNILFSNAHIHAYVVPITKEGVLSNRQLIGTKELSHQQQLRFYDSVAKYFDCEPPMQRTPKKNRSTNKFFSTIADTAIVKDESVEKIKSFTKPKDNEKIDENTISIEYANRMQSEGVQLVTDTLSSMHLAALKQKEQAEDKSMEVSNKYYNRASDIANILKPIMTELNNLGYECEKEEDIPELIHKMSTEARYVRYLNNGLNSIENDKERHEAKAMFKELINNGKALSAVDRQSNLR